MLLGHFQAAEAHPAILNVFGLPEPYPEDLFGDLVTEQLPILLTRTCNEWVSRRHQGFNRQS